MSNSLTQRQIETLVFFSSLLGFWKPCPPTDEGDPVVVAAKLEARQRALTTAFLSKGKAKRGREPQDQLARQLFTVFLNFCFFWFDPSN